jgi:hypothetical protein
MKFGSPAAETSSDGSNQAIETGPRIAGLEVADLEDSSHEGIWRSVDCDNVQIQRNIDSQ